MYIYLVNQFERHWFRSWIFVPPYLNRNVKLRTFIANMKYPKSKHIVDNFSSPSWWIFKVVTINAPLLQSIALGIESWTSNTSLHNVSSCLGNLQIYQMPLKFIYPIIHKIGFHVRCHFWRILRYHLIFKYYYQKKFKKKNAPKIKLHCIYLISFNSNFFKNKIRNVFFEIKNNKLLQNKIHCLTN